MQKTTHVRMWIILAQHISFPNLASIHCQNLINRPGLANFFPAYRKTHTHTQSSAILSWIGISLIGWQNLFGTPLFDWLTWPWYAIIPVTEKTTLCKFLFLSLFSAGRVTEQRDLIGSVPKCNRAQYISMRVPADRTRSLCDYLG
jgi:hypothetical protein